MQPEWFHPDPLAICIEDERARLNETALQTIRHYEQLAIGKHKVRTPFWEDPLTHTIASAMNNHQIDGATIRQVIWDIRQGEVGEFGWGSGKCPPEQLEEYLERIRQKHGDNFDTAHPEAIRDYMTSSGLGVDCSGFVFNVLHRSFQNNGQEQRFLDSLQWPSPDRQDVFRAGVPVYLGKASRSIALAEVQPLDLVLVHYEFARYSHIAMIVEDEQKKLTLAHSSLANTPAGVGTCPLFDADGNLAFHSRFGFSWQHLFDINRLDFRRLRAVEDSI